MEYERKGNPWKVLSELKALWYKLGGGCKCAHAFRDGNWGQRRTGVPSLPHNSPTAWDYRWQFWGFELRSSCLQGKLSELVTHAPTPQQTIQHRLYSYQRRHRYHRHPQTSPTPRKRLALWYWKHSTQAPHSLAKVTRSRELYSISPSWLQSQWWLFRSSSEASASRSPCEPAQGESQMPIEISCRGL